MNGSILNHILKKHLHTQKWFQGFSSVDLPLPPIKKYPALFILNTDDTRGPGEHWCVVIIFNKNRAEFFDSYGKPPCEYNLHESILNYSNTINYNKKRVQGNKPTCGHHCLFFSIQRAEGKSMENILQSLYTNDLYANDNLVYSFIKNSYGNEYASFL